MEIYLLNNDCDLWDITVNGPQPIKNRMQPRSEERKLIALNIRALTNLLYALISGKYNRCIDKIIDHIQNHKSD